MVEQMKHDPTLERKVLSVAFMNTVLSRKLLECEEKDFYDPIRQKIFGKIKEFLNNGRLVELTTLCGEFDYEEKITNEITECSSIMFTDSFINDHIDQLKELRNYRMFQTVKLAKSHEELMDMVSRMNESMYRGRSSIIAPDKLINDVLQYYEKGEEDIYSSGWPMLDRYLQFTHGLLYIVTGIPSSGKSEWLDALMLNMAKEHNWKTVFFSPENYPIERHVRKFVEKIANSPFFMSDNARGMSKQDVVNALGVVNNNMRFMYPPPEKRTLDDILAQAGVAMGKEKIDAIVLDPWNEIGVHDSHVNVSETQYISYALTRIRAFARYYRVAIFLVAHPTKLSKDDEGNYPVPTLYNISGSAHWYNKADAGIVVHRDPFSQTMKHRVEIYIQKVRFKQHGERGLVTLDYDVRSGNFSEVLP